jgi:aryl-alcohol dehydrogenase-like predicted oxidoreductase
VEYRILGRTQLQVSALGFGCGNVGGLMVRGTPKEREQAVARAMELGINYFDTAPVYGDLLSERHLGEVLRSLKAPVYVGTKVRLTAADHADITGAVTRSVEASLGRLQLERVDLIQFHNLIVSERHADRFDVTEVLDQVIPALRGLQGQGKARFVGITALGDTPAVHRVLDSGAVDTAQVCFNLLNPSANHAVPKGFPGQDFGRLLDHARAQSVGVVGIRALAAGALSGVEARHPVAVPSVDPIASAPDYGTDVSHARMLQPLVDEGHAESLVEAALRFALTADAMSTVLLGYSSQEHLEYAAAAMAKGPLPKAALERLPALWARLASA